MKVVVISQAKGSQKNNVKLLRISEGGVNRFFQNRGSFMGNCYAHSWYIIRVGGCGFKAVIFT